MVSLQRVDLDDRGRLLEALVAHEFRGRAVQRAQSSLARGGPAAGAAALALVAHQALEALLVDAEPVLGGDLERQLEREAERVVQLEGLVGADALLAALLRARDEVVEQLGALLERAPEPGLLGLQPAVDELALACELGIRRAHQLDHAVAERRQEAGLDADRAALLDRAAHDPPQDVAAVLVGGHHAVGDQEGHRARVVGEDPQRPVARVGHLRQLAPELDERRELVGVEDALDALLDDRHAVEAQAGVDVLRRQRRQRVGGIRIILVELHEDEVPVLQEALVLAAGQVVLGAELEATVEVELAARAARPRRADLPEVLRARQTDDPLTRDAHGLPGGDRLLVRAEAERVVALEHRRPQVAPGRSRSPPARAPRPTRQRPA